MDRLFGNRVINYRALFSFQPLGKDVQQHLKNVYTTLAMGLIAAAAGAWVHIFSRFLQAGFLTSIAGIAFILAVYFIPHKGENVVKRLLCFLSATFFIGMSLGPLLEAVSVINPSIIPTAFLGTSLIFICFTVSALLNQNRSFLYMSGFLMSALMVLSVGSLINIFWRSQMLFTAELYLGFAVFCLFVLFDTQLMVEKRRMGDDDFIWHSLDLFIDFVEIFRHLLVILTRNERRRNED
jgi:FtsH-binding integral membrane protein